MTWNNTDEQNALIDELLSYFENFRQSDIYETRDDWDTYFMKLAQQVSTRSNDPQTQYGCVIVSPTKEVVATGYNGTIRDIPKNLLPNLRPEKYEWMIHSEQNALLSCARQGKSTLGCTVYVTGVPCLLCLQFMWQAGITEIVYIEHKANMLTEDMQKKILLVQMLTNGKLNMRKLEGAKND